MNGDFLPDIVLAPAEPAGGRYRISWFERGSDPKALWSEHVIEGQVETVLHGLVVADVSGDGWPDLVVAEMEQGADPDRVRALVSDGARRFSSATIANGGSHSLQGGDLDGDGDSDLFGANWLSGTPVGAPVRLWRNLSQGPVPKPTPTPAVVGDVPLCNLEDDGVQKTRMVPRDKVQRLLDRGLTRGECPDPSNGRVLCGAKRGKRVNVLVPEAKVQALLDKGLSTLGECGAP